MLSAQHPEKKGHKLNDNELIAQMVVSLLGGYHTVSCTLSLVCYHLAVHPDIIFVHYVKRLHMMNLKICFTFKRAFLKHCDCIHQVFSYQNFALLS